jgi:hypothetical protein
MNLGKRLFGTARHADRNERQRRLDAKIDQVYRNGVRLTYTDKDGAIRPMPIRK